MFDIRNLSTFVHFVWLSNNSWFRFINLAQYWYSAIKRNGAVLHRKSEKKFWTSHNFFLDTTVRTKSKLPNTIPRCTSCFTQFNTTANTLKMALETTILRSLHNLGRYNKHLFPLSRPSAASLELWKPYYGIMPNNTLYCFLKKSLHIRRSWWNRKQQKSSAHMEHFVTLDRLILIRNCCAKLLLNVVISTNITPLSQTKSSF